MRELIVCLLIALTLSDRAFCQRADQRPNILWIVSEDNSAFIGAYGDRFATTPNIDDLARRGVRFTHAFTTAPVCAPARSTLITGMYPSSLGTEHMRSTYPVPSMVRFFPRYLREAGYYTSNNAKKDYNTVDQEEAWDESGPRATYRNRKQGQPFFAVFNITISHESQLHETIPAAQLTHNPEEVPIPPYHPATSEMKHDWAQYYDRIQAMDEQVGKIIGELDEAGLSNNTIVFYYSDHGGVLGRSKRFMYESGLHVPLIIRFPEMYKDLAPASPGSVSSRLVSFVDFAPTILSLAGIQPPAYMQGKAFLGTQKTPAGDYAFASRGRMDERLDMVRSVRDTKYRYIRNYMPHKIYGQYLEYLWKAPSMVSWEKAWRNGQLNEIQSAFWKPKPTEELYDVETDPHNIHNLAGNPQYAATLERMRLENRKWILKHRDAGFIPEPLMAEISKSESLYDYAHSRDYPLETILETAEMASSKDVKGFPGVLERLTNDNAIVRYWAVMGCIVHYEDAEAARPRLKQLANDNDISVRTAVAEALYMLGDKDEALRVLKKSLKSDNNMARLHALNILEVMGDDARPALGEIRSVLKDDIKDADYDVRAASRIIKLLEKD